MKIGIVYDTLQPSKGDHGTHLAFTGLSDMEIVLADPNQQADLTQIGAQRHYHDFRQMLLTERPEATVVCSRLPDDHLPVIMAALEAGSHVLCEKPLCATLAEADIMAEMAEKKGLLIAVAHLARYAPVFNTLKRLLAEGMIGTPLTFYGRGKEDERGGGEDMMVLGTHILDLGNYLFGEPSELCASVRYQGEKLRHGQVSDTTEPVGLVAGDEVFAQYQFANGVKGIFESRKGMFNGRQTRMGITVQGTEGALSVRFDKMRALRLTRSEFPSEDESAYEDIPIDKPPEIPGATELHHGATPNEQFLKYFTVANRYAAWDLCNAIREQRQPRSSVYDARITLEMIYAVYASQLTGKRIEFPLKDRKHPLAK